MSPPGTIYFAQAVGGGPIKIGWTGGDVNRRIRALQSACPFELIVTRTTPGTRADERELHRRHRFDRLRGEWYYPSPDVAGLADGHGEEALVDATVAAYNELRAEGKA